MKKALEDSRLAIYVPCRYRLTSDHADDDEDEVGRQQEEYDNGVAVDIESFATTGHQELRRNLTIVVVPIYSLHSLERNFQTENF